MISKDIPSVASNPRRLAPRVVPRLPKIPWNRLMEVTGYLAALLIVWEAAVGFFSIPSYLLPPPSSVALALNEGIQSGVYLYNLTITMTEVIVGFGIGALLGLLLGIGIATVAAIERVLYPYVIAIQTVPKVAIAPLMIVWFGFGLQSKIIIVAMASMFPVLVNTIAGLKAADEDRISLVRALCGSGIDVLRFVQIPSALPYIFAGLNTALVLAVISAIVGEFVGARHGIGVLIMQANVSLDVAGVFALLVVLALSGVCLTMILRAVERRICFWSGRSTR